MASLHISLSDEMRTFVDNQVQGGSYHNHSEYVRDLIRHDQEHKSRQQVEALLLEGLQSGEPVPMTSEEWQVIRKQVRSQAAKRLRSRG